MKHFGVDLVRYLNDDAYKKDMASSTPQSPVPKESKTGFSPGENLQLGMGGQLYDNASMEVNGA